MIIRKATAFIAALLIAAVFMPLQAGAETTEEYDVSGVDRTDWNAIQEQYRFDDSVRNLIFVKYEGQAKATLCMYEKDEVNNWTEKLNCPAYTGGNGIDKQKEGDCRTPTGDFPITQAFGIKDDPGSQIEYLKVDDNHYWCADEYYNQLVDISQQNHDCRGEHLIDYTKQYAYAMNIGYNTEGIEGEGSAIFLHCFGDSDHTLGCIAVSEENMIKLLQTCAPGTRICIYDN